MVIKHTSILLYKTTGADTVPTISYFLKKKQTSIRLCQDPAVKHNNTIMISTILIQQQKFKLVYTSNMFRPGLAVTYEHQDQKIINIKS